MKNWAPAMDVAVHIQRSTLDCYSHAHRFFSMGILNPIKLTTEINHHTYLQIRPVRVGNDLGQE